jgi:flagellar protein FlaF
VSNLAEQSFVAPAMRLNGAAAAYGAVIRGTAPPRDIEYRVLARLIAMLKQASSPGAGPAAMHEALHETRMVWTAFLMDLASPGNRWDDVGKARLISLARWLINETDRVQRGASQPDSLITVMQPVADGLKPASLSLMGQE